MATLAERVRAVVVDMRRRAADRIAASPRLYRAAVALDVLRGAVPVATARRALSQRNYKGAAVNYHTQNWNPTGAGPNTIIGKKAATLRARSRDLVRNNPQAAGAVQKLTTRVIGCGILPRTKTDDEALNRRVDDLWDAWARQAAVDTDLSVYGLQEMAFRAMLESGEVLQRRRTRRADDLSAGRRLSVPLQVQVLEADFLDPLKTETLTSEDGREVGHIVQGVEFDAIDRRVAYWLYPTHPGEQLVGTLGSITALFTSRRVPADGLAHLYQALRPGQVRGVPWLSPVIRTLHDVDDYGDTELLRQKLAACLVAFVQLDDQGEPTHLGAPENGDDGTRPVVDVNGNPLERLEPGMIALLRGSKDVRMTQPTGVGGYPEYIASQLQRIAAGTGLTYEQLSADLSRVNYSSYRAGNLETRAMVEALQENLVIPLVCEPVRRWWIDAAVAAGLVPDREYPTEWTPPRFEDVDRVKEATADLLEMRSGTASRTGILARKGYDPDKVTLEIAEDAARNDRLGLVFDSDPRRTSGAGTGQKADGENDGARLVRAAALHAATEGDLDGAEALARAASALSEDPRPNGSRPPAS